MTPFVTALASIAGCGVACVAYGTLIERRWYRVRRVTLHGALRAGARGPLRVLHVSDLHLTPGQQHKIDFVRSLRDESYDLVVATGDLLGAEGAEELAAALLSELTDGDTPGLLVLGSNDLYGPTPKSPLLYFTDPDVRRHGVRLDTDTLVARLAEGGYRTLRNDATVLETAAGPVGAGGIDDPHLSDTKIPATEVVTPAQDGLVASLGLVHAPYTAALDVLHAAGHDLFLSGHTHGGQVRFPPIGAVVGNCDLPLSQIRGESRYRDRWLHISPGLGTSIYAPFRFACRPEATVLTLAP